jgi:subtilisin family serine protease
MRRLAAAALMCGLLALAVPGVAAAARIVVVREPGVRAATVRAGGEKLSALSGLRAEVLRVPAASRDRIVARLNRMPGVRSAEPDIRLHVMGPDRSSEQWAPDRVRAPSTWPLTTGAGVTVAVVDTGANFGHEDLLGRLIAGPDYVDGGEPDDDNGHGTHVTVAIVGDKDGQGVNGIAPSAHALVLRALGADGFGDVSDIAAAFDYAGSQGIPIVSASLGGPVFSPLLDDAIRAHPRTLYIVAAGNDGSDDDLAPTYPCNSRALNVICVGATDKAEAAASFSNFGRTSVDVFAPGVDILSGWLAPQNFALASGTSMATPVVSGIAALTLARKPALSALALKNTVLNGAVPIAALASLSVTGARADALRAVSLTPADADRDGIGDAWDDCTGAADAGQADADGDGLGDACDDDDADGVPFSRDACPAITSPHSTNGCPETIDTDGDGVFDVVDVCATTPGPARFHGCPDTRDRDGDGRVDSLDACRSQFAHTATGCPRPRVRSVRVRKTRCDGRPCLKVHVVLAKSADVTVTAQRCRRHGPRCQWRSLVSAHRRDRAFSVTLKPRLRHGRYRVRAVARNAEGRSRPRSAALRIP